MVLSTVWIVSRDLGNGIVSGKYFWFDASMALLSVASIPAAIIKRRERLSFALPDLLILLFSLAAVLITLNHTGRLTNKCLLLILAAAFYFYLRIFLAGKSRLMYRLCGLAFVVTGFVEAVWGLMQLYGFAPSQHHLFKTTGSFFNPGPYSGWLAMVFPMALGYVVFNYLNRKGLKVIRSLPPVHENGRRLTTILCFITALCIILILPSAMSRASWLAALGGCAFVGIAYSVSEKKGGLFRSYFQKYRKKIILLSVAAVVLLAVSMAGLFLLKKDSASGRAFIWKIALQTIVKHPFGVGLGNFAGSYGEVQAAYFASGAGSEREEYVAEGVEYAFNEYLQICIETGIIPFLVFLAFAVSVLVSGIRNRNILPAGSLVSLLIFASMSYPFNVLPFIIAFVFLSALCMTDNNHAGNDQPKKQYPKFVIWAFLMTVPVSIALLSADSPSNFNFQLSYQAYQQWSKHREIGQEQYPYLQDEIKFLFEYAQSLSKSGEYEKSNKILQEAMQISCDPMLYNIMGKNYQSLQEYKLAEQNLQKAANLVPSRLYPHYLLAKLYYEMGLMEKTELEINIVLTKTPKVDSKAVEEMRKELKKLEIHKK
jgi:O-antigen ligase